MPTESNSKSGSGGEFFPDNILTESGLIFEKEFDYKLENRSYTDIIQLKSLSNGISALQFRLLVNKTAGDSTILIFGNLQKGPDVSDTNWVLVYNVIKGPIVPNGASADEIYVLLYNTTQNGVLPPGDYNNLIKVNYAVADLPDDQNNIKSSFRIAYALASTPQGIQVDITPSRDEFKIYARNENWAQGLVFEKDTVYRLEDDSYTDIMQIKDLGFKAQALQFRLEVNKAEDDNVILTFQNIQKGYDVHDESWVLDYTVFRGPLTGNGASKDEILALLYNLEQDNGLPEGDHNNLLKVTYRVADLQPLQDSIKSSIKITEALASTFEGFPVDITPSRDQLVVIARNRTGYYGDVNADGCIDVLDLMMVVDHIIGRDSLEGDQFARADLAPWIQGNPQPDPDGVVNVQDLALLQNIILTGVYPDGTPIEACSYTNVQKIIGDSNAKVTIYINSEGITIYLDTRIAIRAAQIEFGDVSSDPQNMSISTGLGEGYYKYINKILRTLLYDRQGYKIFEVGADLLADMPFHISQSHNVVLNKLILEDINNQMIMDCEVEIIYGNPPEIPMTYMLYQNFPNPFNPGTTIQYSLPERSSVVLKVYDILGNEVATPVDEVKNRGTYSMMFFSKGLASGVYFYRMQAFPVDTQGKGYMQTKKMLLLK